jgi:hypothetical protein
MRSKKSTWTDKNYGVHLEPKGLTELVSTQEQMFNARALLLERVFKKRQT